MFRAVVCEKLSPAFAAGINGLTIRSVPRVPLRSHDVRIKVLASGINYFDLLTLVGKYQHRPELPFTPGAEASGTVIEVGSSVQNIKVGDEVMVGMAQGACASEMVTSSLSCLPKPASFSHEEAAAFPVGFMTAYHGLVQRGQLKEGETLLVTGAAGGMGMFAVQLGKLIGCKVIAAASTPEKLAAAKWGADELINYSNENLKDKLKKLTGGKGVDVCYEIVGGEVFDACTRCMASEGRLLVVGFASGVIPNVPANLPLIKGYSVVGVRAGESFRVHPNLLEEMQSQVAKWLKKGCLPAPLVTKYESDSFKDAFFSLANREIKGKAVLSWANEAKL